MTQLTKRDRYTLQRVSWSQAEVTPSVNILIVNDKMQKLSSVIDYTRSESSVILVAPSQNHGNGFTSFCDEKQRAHAGLSIGIMHELNMDGRPSSAGESVADGVKMVSTRSREGSGQRSGLQAIKKQGITLLDWRCARSDGFSRVGRDY